jgi:hypothetical protein
LAIIHLQGATGNQLFCLFAGITYEEVSGHSSIFDESFLQPIEVRHPGGLSDFDVYFGGTKYVVKSSHKRINKTQIILDRILFKISNTKSQLYFLSRQHRSSVFGYDADFKLTKRYKKVIGFFQTYFYADRAQETLGKLEICVKNPSNWFAEKSEEIKSSLNSVAIHIRRGDYAQNIDGIGLLSFEYFYKALEVLLEKKNISSVYIFSDEDIDISAFRSRFPNLDFKVINPPSESKPVECIILMSLAANRIISNSSFSWWAAYLADKAHNNYSPSPWFRNKKAPELLIPDTWNKLNSIWAERNDE